MQFNISRRQAFLISLFAGLGGAGPSRAAAAALPESLRRGFNLPDQAPMRADHVARTETLRGLRQLGMTHVRLPLVAEYMLTQFSGPATISSTLDDLDRALQRLLSLGYTVSVDLHPESDFTARQRSDPGKAHRLLLTGWTQLAKRLVRYPADRIVAELLNEPATTDAIWRPFVEQLARSVRVVLPNNYIIVGPAPYQRIDALANWVPLADKKIVYACHYYDPMMFTHQGASWDTSTPWGRTTGVPFPTNIADPRLLDLARKADLAGDAEVARELREMASQAWGYPSIAAQFAALGRWSAQHAAPVVVNELGVLKWKAARADRLAWLAATRVAIEAQGFGWTHWDYSTGFGLLDDAGAIDEGVIRALLSTPAGEPSTPNAPGANAARPPSPGRGLGGR